MKKLIPRSPLLDIKMVRKVKLLRKKMVIKQGRKMIMPFRDIAAALGKDVKQVYKWSKYDIE